MDIKNRMKTEMYNYGRLQDTGGGPDYYEMDAEVLEAAYAAVPTTVYEELSPDTARITLVTTWEGHEFKNVVLSGPKWDVLDYHEGRMTFEEVKTKWSARTKAR